MIRIFLSRRMQRSTAQLSSELQAKLEAILQAVSRDFGQPHNHSGLGLRKIGVNFWECRLDLRLRVVFKQERESLVVWDIMNHDEIRAWLKQGL